MVEELTPSRNEGAELSGTLEALGREVRACHDRALAFEDPTASARVLFQRAIRERPSASRTGRRTRSASFAAALILVAAVAIFAFSMRPRSLDFTVGTRPGIVGAWIAATEGSQLPLVFSDGTSIVLARGSEARVANLRSRGADVVLERGHLEARVVHRTKTAWTVDVGPYQVHVTGTRFDVAWNPVEHRFALHLYEGSVVVDGCEILRRTVVAGESIHLLCNEGDPANATVEESADASAAPVLASRAPLTTPSSAPPTVLSAEIPLVDSSPHRAVPESLAPLPATDARRASSDDLGEFRALMAAGKAGAAFHAVELQFDDRCEDAPAGDLLLLADAARFAGNPSRAKQAWVAARNRFASEKAVVGRAAFLLGRAELEDGTAQQAVAWFTLSLHEDPAGALAREALGRIIEAQQKGGNAVAARNAAREYLATYPNGPHAKLAASLAHE